MANSKLHDDFLNEFEPLEDPKASVSAMLKALADRIESCQGNIVKLTDLKTVLREDPDKVAKAVLANTPHAKNRTQTTASYDAPSSAFEMPREGVRQGMALSTNDHRDQQFPENSNTEPEKQRIRQEQVVRDRGGMITVNEDMPDVPKADREYDEKAKADTKAVQEGKHPDDTQGSTVSDAEAERQREAEREREAERRRLNRPA